MAVTSFLMQGVSCSEITDAEVPERRSGTLSVLCSMNSKELSVQRSKYASQSPSMLEKPGNGKIIHDNVSLMHLSPSRSAGEQNDKCSGDDSFYSSFPGSPRNRKSGENIFEELNSPVPEDYDYSKSTEYSYAIEPQNFDRNNGSRSITYDTGDGGSDVNKEQSERGLFFLKENLTDILSNSIEADMSSIFLPHPEKSSTEMKKEKEMAKELGPICVGKYAEQRRELDYSYHSQYTPERQLFHDILIGRCWWRSNHSFGHEQGQTKILLLPQISSFNFLFLHSVLPCFLAFLFSSFFTFFFIVYYSASRIPRFSP